MGLGGTTVTVFVTVCVVVVVVVVVIVSKMVVGTTWVTVAAIGTTGPKSVKYSN